MKRNVTKKVITAGMFVVVLGFGFVMNVLTAKEEIAKSVRADLLAKESVRTMVSNVETTINEKVSYRYPLIEAYGIAMDFLNKDEENAFEVIKDKTGSLHLTSFATGPKDTTDYAKELVAYKNAIIDKNVSFFYAMTPDKVIEGVTEFEAGLPYAYANETADALIENLDKAKIDVIDFRKTLIDSGLNKNDLFYKTDHHWTTNAAFASYQALVKYLEEQYGFQSELLKTNTDPFQFNQVVYKKSFLGSLGRKTGKYYSGIDDFTLIYPKFETDYTYEMTTPNGVFTSMGRFEEVLLNTAMLQNTTSLYEEQADRYETYLYGNQPYVKITNHNCNDGSKILIVKDSFMLPLASYLSTVFEEVHLVDPRYYEGSIVELTNSIKGLDYVVVSFSPQNIADEFFAF